MWAGGVATLVVTVAPQRRDDKDHALDPLLGRGGDGRGAKMKVGWEFGISRFQNFKMSGQAWTSKARPGQIQAKFKVDLWLVCG